MERKIPTFEEYSPKFSENIIKENLEKIGDLQWSKTPGVKKIDGILGGLIHDVLNFSDVGETYETIINSVFMYKQIWKTEYEMSVLNILTKIIYEIDISNDYLMKLSQTGDDLKIAGKNKCKMIEKMKEGIFALYDLDSPGGVGVLVEFVRIICFRSGYIDEDSQFNKLFETIREEYCNLRFPKNEEKSKICQYSDLKDQLSKNLDKIAEENGFREEDQIKKDQIKEEDLVKKDQIKEEDLVKKDQIKRKI